MRDYSKSSHLTEPTIDQRVLQAIKFGIQEELPRGREPLYYEPELFYNQVGHLMVVRLERDVYAEEVLRRDLSKTVEFDYPATWWDMLKADSLPRWITRWLSPAQYRTARRVVEMRTSTVALLPDYVPPQGAGPTVIIHEMPTSDFMAYA